VITIKFWLCQDFFAECKGVLSSVARRQTWYRSPILSRLPFARTKPSYIVGTRSQLEYICHAQPQFTHATRLHQLWERQVFPAGDVYHLHAERKAESQRCRDLCRLRSHHGQGRRYGRRVRLGLPCPAREFSHGMRKPPRRTGAAWWNLLSGFFSGTGSDIGEAERKGESRAPLTLPQLSWLTLWRAWCLASVSPDVNHEIDGLSLFAEFRR